LKKTKQKTFYFYAHLLAYKGNKDSIISIFLFKDFKNLFVVFSNSYEEAGLAKGGNTPVASSRIFKAQGKLKSVCLAQPKNHSHNTSPINSSLPLATTCSTHMWALKI